MTTIDHDAELARAGANVTGLGGQMENHLGRRLSGGSPQLLAVLEHAAMGPETAELLEQGVPVFLELHIVVWGHAIDANDFMALLEQARGQVKTDKARSSCNQAAHR